MNTVFYMDDTQEEIIMDAGKSEYAQPVDIKSILHERVATALNTQYAPIIKMSNYLGQEEFIDLVSEAAKDWTESCFP